MSAEEIGTLIVVVLKARNLNDKHKFRKQDVYGKIGLGGKYQQTKTEIKGGQHPVWDEELRFPVMKASSSKFREMEVSCWSKEPREDDCLGKATVDITKIIQTGEFDEWVPLSLDDVQRGEIYLEITFYSHGPPPPQAVAPAPAPGPVSNAPRPALAVPAYLSNNLQRRPSKLKPHERLSRPDVVQGYPPQPGHQQNGYGAHRPHQPSNLGPAVPYKDNRPGSVMDQQQPQSPHGQPAGPPPPSLLRPGATGHPSSRPQAESLSSPQNVPAGPNPYLTPIAGAPLNRPVSAAPSGQAAPNPYLSSSPQGTPGYQPQQQTSYPPNPYQPSYTPAPPQSHTPAPPQSYTPAPPQAYTPAPHPSQSPVSPTAPAGPPLLWASMGPESSAPAPPPPGGFAFPTPNFPAGPPGHARRPSEPYQPPWGSGGPSPPRVSSPYDYDSRYDRRDDPSLLNRYQTPLPLPPGASRANGGSGGRNSSASPTRPAPVPPKPAPPTPPSSKSTASASSSSSPPASGPDARRLAELRWLEEEAKRRSEQEKKDMELALQLDRELNLS